MRIEKGDYLVVQLDEKKRALCCVTATSASGIKAILDGKSKARPSTEERIRFDPEDIVANLGPDPTPGNSYGVNVEPFVKMIEVKPWGEVYFFTRPSKFERKKLLETFKALGRKFNQMGLTGNLPIEVEVRPPKGKNLGWYKFHAADTKIDHMGIRPVEAPLFPYVIAHEFGHHVWFTFVPQSIRQKWIELYHKSVTVQVVSAKQLQQLRKEFLDAGMSVPKFRKQLSTDAIDSAFSREVFDEVLRHILRVHKLNSRNIDTLAQNGNDLRQYWPAREIDVGAQDLVISEYGKSSVEEFFSESFAYYIAGMELSPRVNKAMERTLERVSNN